LRIAVISDIHSNLEAFQAVIANLPQHDALIFLGDLVGYGPQPNEVVEQLRQLEPQVALMGNHDYAVVSGDTSGFSTHARVAVEWTRRQIKNEALDYLSTLYPSANITLNRTRVSLFHGSPEDPLNEYVFPGIPNSLAKELIQRAMSSVVLLGHTHMPMLYSFEKSMLANPGSVGQPRDGDPRASFAVLSLSGTELSFEIRRVKYEIETVAKRIFEEGLPSFLGYRLYEGI
jgi:putative phosphoesterase